MNKLKRQVISVLGSGALLLNMVAPIGAQTTIEISGNGTGSDNDAVVSLESSTSVAQFNDANIRNDIDASADTGGNDAKDNTGGSVSIETGDASTEVKVENTVNSNSADVNGCCPSGADVLIAGNGSDSDNTVELKLKNETEVYQENAAKIRNDVDASADTGGNDANDNTGGSVSIETGDASVDVEVSNMANANWAQVGGGNGGGSVSARILGNGTHSDNDIALAISRSLSIAQFNDADIRNKVDADADTGDNDAKDNTGGTVSIETGDAEVDVSVDNMVNFNWADADCGCLLNLLAKIAGNGSDSDNTIAAELSDETEVFQDNVWDCKSKKGHHDAGSEGWWWHKKPCNDVDADADTGDNDVKDNTGDPGVDPSIETGDAETTVEVSNAGNSNVYGSDVPGDWPDFEFNFNISLSWAQLLALLGM